MKDYFRSETLDLLLRTVLLAAILVVVSFIYFRLFAWARRKVLKTESTFDDYAVNLFRSPVLLLVYWFFLFPFISLYRNFAVHGALLKISSLLLIFTLAWLAIQFISAGAYYIQARFDAGGTTSIKARKNLTQVKVFRAIAVTIIVIIAIGAGLMTFEQARKVGVSVLTSAGIIGVIVGIAAQKSLGMILAGIQLAITQPIRIDDTVILEGEFGIIEEIQLTYVIVRIWDERRMIVPVTYFLEKPFQNLTRTTSGTTGTISLYVDYGFPVDSIRKVLPGLLGNNTNWDGRTANIEVSDSTGNYKEIRIVLSSSDSGKNWNLRTAIREKLIDFINANYPDAFARIRIKTVQ
jgi:small-conductance mechanosensitive channel